MRGYTLVRTPQGWPQGWTVTVYRDGQHERTWRFRYRFQTWPVIWNLRLRGVKPL